MKRILSLIAIVAILVMSGCEKDTEGVVTGTVYYPTFVNSGNQINVVGVGETFTVPEVKVYDGEKDITDESSIIGLDEVDLETPGYYPVYFSATSADGYDGSYTLTIFVYDPGFADAPVIGNYDGGLEGRGGGPVVISEYQKGVYQVDDFFGGYYNVYVGYGSAYVASGYLIYVGDDTFIMRNVSTPWGPIQDEEGIDRDPTTGDLTYTAYFLADGYNWGGLMFTLSPVEE